MKTVITRCRGAWVAISNLRIYPPTDVFGDASETVEELLYWILISWVYHLWPSTLSICASICPFTNHFVVISQARWQLTWRGNDVCLNKCQFFCMQEGALPDLSAITNWLSCLITRSITHIFKIQSTKPGKVTLGKSVLQFFNWGINQIRGNILCLRRGTFLCFEQLMSCKFFFRGGRAGRW